MSSDDDDCGAERVFSGSGAQTTVVVAAAGKSFIYMKREISPAVCLRRSETDWEWNGTEHLPGSSPALASK